MICNKPLGMLVAGAFLFTEGCGGLSQAYKDAECIVGSDDPDKQCPPGSHCLDDRKCHSVCTVGQSIECDPTDACIDSVCQNFSLACSTHEQCVSVADARWYCSELDGTCRKLPTGVSTCSDGVRGSSEESDVDCGGSCAPCAAGRRCSTNADCASSKCQGSLCQLPGGQLGELCTDANDCESGFCADGFCCNALCDGTCEACVAGHCEALADGTDLDNECPGTTACNGQRGCWNKALGDFCNAPYQCLGGQCADGRCCDSACSNPCERCDDSAALGTCTAVTSAEDPGACDPTMIAGACTLAPCMCSSLGDCGSATGVVCSSDAQCASKVCMTGVCSSQPWAGVKQRGSASRTQQRGMVLTDVASGVAVDNAGNVYVTGYTDGSLDGNTSAGGADLVMVKYDPSGNWAWTRQYGSTADDRAFAVAVDASGNVYVTGFTLGSLDGNTNSGGNDLFVVKYDPLGVLQ